MLLSFSATGSFTVCAVCRASCSNDCNGEVAYDDVQEHARDIDGHASLDDNGGMMIISSVLVMMVTDSEDDNGDADDCNHAITIVTKKQQRWKSLVGYTQKLAA